jgi:hypothetical protein
MQTLCATPATGFVRKEDLYEEITVCFQNTLWGIKAREALADDGIRYFTYPLTVTHVIWGGEAFHHGLAVGDMVVEMNSVRVTSSRGDLLDISSQQKGVSPSVQEMLRLGGPCSMKLMRRKRGEMQCSDCQSFDLIEVVERGDLVCRDCATVQRSKLIFNGMSWENESTTFVDRPDPSCCDHWGETSRYIDDICEKLELGSSISAQAKAEVLLFHKNNGGSGRKKMRYKPFEALAASCVLVVCRFKQIGRTEREVLAVCSCTKRNLALVLRGVNRSIVELSNRRIPCSVPSDVVERFCANMQTSKTVVKTANHVLQVNPHD